MASGLAMKIFFLLLFLLPSLAHASWTEIATGMNYQKIKLSIDDKSVTAHVVKLNPKLVTIKPVLVGAPATAKKMLSKTSAMLIVNANFFDVNNQALGLVVVDRVVKNPFKKISWWGVLCVNQDAVAILKGDDYHDGVCEQAVQVGPRLVINGAAAVLKDESTRKTAVGVNQKGDVFLVVTQERLPIKTLADFFVKPETQGGLGCANALNFDGGSSSELAVKVGAFTLNVESFINFPVGLGVFER